MPLDQSRIQGFGNTPVDSAPQKEGFWAAIEDQMSNPTVRSALDTVQLRFADAYYVASQDMSEMAHEIKTIFASAVGRVPEPVKPPVDEEIPPRAKDPDVTEEVRNEVTELMSSFCRSYPATRVVPTLQELEGLWLKCSALPPNSVCGSLYDQLSWSNGDIEWQPRFRALHILEYFYVKGGLGRDIANTILNIGSGLLEHLANDVPQCKDKATQVILVLVGKVESQVAVVSLSDAPVQSPATSGTDPVGAVAAVPVVQDLLDLSTPAPAPVAVHGDLLSLSTPVSHSMDATPIDLPPTNGDLLCMTMEPAPPKAVEPLLLGGLEPSCKGECGDLATLRFNDPPPLSAGLQGLSAAGFQFAPTPLPGFGVAQQMNLSNGSSPFVGTAFSGNGTGQPSSMAAALTCSKTSAALPSSLLLGSPSHISSQNRTIPPHIPSCLDSPEKVPDPFGFVADFMV